jgi:hypothetical protein
MCPKCPRYSLKLLSMSIKPSIMIRLHVFSRLQYARTWNGEPCVKQSVVTTTFQAALYTGAISTFITTCHHEVPQNQCKIKRLVMYACKHVYGDVFWPILAGKDWVFIINSFHLSQILRWTVFHRLRAGAQHYFTPSLTLWAGTLAIFVYLWPWVFLGIYANLGKFIKISPVVCTKWNYFIQKDLYLNTSWCSHFNSLFQERFGVYYRAWSGSVLPFTCYSHWFSCYFEQRGKLMKALPAVWNYNFND